MSELDGEHLCTALNDFATYAGADRLNTLDYLLAHTRRALKGRIALYFLGEQVADGGDCGDIHLSHLNAGIPAQINFVKCLW
jgi:hypothetical protein